MTTALPITADGRFQVLESQFDHNGSHDVEIIDHRPGVDEIVPPNIITNERRRIRELARRADPMSHLVQWVRVDQIVPVSTPEGQRVTYQLTVSRLDPSYR